MFKILLLSTFLTLFYSVNTIFGQVVINEFVAWNDSLSSIKDPSGETEDWIELYNIGSSSVDLSGYGLSDDYDELLKWQFPAQTIIPGNGYLIIWADKDEEQEGLHASFKLKKDGERVVLSTEAGVVLDSTSFGAQTVNLALARMPNGTGDFVIQNPTFNAMNIVVSLLNPNHTISIQISPNLATDHITLQMEAIAYKIQIISISGQVMLSQKVNTTTHRIDLNGWDNGIYFIKLMDQQGNTGLEKFMIQK